MTAQGRKRVLATVRRIVLKIGSGILASQSQGLNQERIARLSREVAQLRAKGLEVVIVSSGAVLSGMDTLGLKAWPRSLPLRQAAAAVGQSRLMWTYARTFAAEGLQVAQVLLTHDDLADRSRSLNARTTLLTLLEHGAIPVINENDTVAVEELTFGDNDRLAGHVTTLVDAQCLIILSDVDGLCTADPRKDSRAALIPLVNTVTPAIERLAGGASGLGGRGGMATKVQAAKWAARHGAATIIVNGEPAGLLHKSLAGEEVGTFFMPAAGRHPRGSGGRHPRGSGGRHPRGSGGRRTSAG